MHDNFKNDLYRIVVFVILAMQMSISYSYNNSASGGDLDTSSSAKDMEITVRSAGLDLPGSLISSGRSPRTLFLFLPGSGPTDRNGDNPLGVSGSPYRQLARQLSDYGIGSIRFDKRDIVGDGSIHVERIDEYVDDANAFIEYAKLNTGVRCVWLLGHSEGGLIALITGSKNRQSVCGVVLLNCPARNFSDILIDQANKILDEKAFNQVRVAINSLRSGIYIKASALPRPFDMILRSDVQSLLISEFSRSPSEVAAGLNLPIIIVQGTIDGQVDPVEAKMLHKSAPSSRLHFIEGMNHFLQMEQSSFLSYPPECRYGQKCVVPSELGRVISGDVFSLEY